MNKHERGFTDSAMIESNCVDTLTRMMGRKGQRDPTHSTVVDTVIGVARAPVSPASSYRLRGVRGRDVSGLRFSRINIIIYCTEFLE